tara:strand:- start:17643 stop:20951 length:3309 start_codon:yes stop_codon:yes gene_type:complete
MKRRVRIKRLPKAKVGQQVDYSLYNDNAAMGGRSTQSMQQPALSLSKFITSVPRDEANVEAEGGETVLGDLNGDGIPEHKIIKGPRHSSGGVPLSLPDDTFIYSDTRSMKVKDPKLLKRFGKNEKKSLTPAKIAKQYDINKYRKILEDPDSDQLSRKTAELMIKNYNLKLAELALVQESMKGMPQGLPAVAQPAAKIYNIEEADIVNPQLKAVNQQLTKKVEEKEGGGEDGEMSEDVAEAEEMNQAPVAQPSMSFGGRILRAQNGIDVQQAEVQDEPQSFYDYARGEYDYFINNPDMWNQDPDMMNADGTFKFCLDCLVKDYNNPDHLQGIVRLMEEGLTEGPHNTEWSNDLDLFYQGLEQYGIDAPKISEKQYGGMPMAMYGMMMGGYDMPFYDTPKASVGRSIPKAQNGVEINVNDPDYERKAWQANQDGKKIIRVNADGTKSIGKYQTGVTPDYDEETMGTDFGTTPSGKAAAIQYYLLKEGFKDPKIRDQFNKEYENSISDVRGYRNAAAKTANEASLRAFNPDERIEQFMKMQKRNLMFKAKQIDPVLFSNSGKGFRSWPDVEARINSGMDVVNPETGTPITTQTDFNSAKKFIAEEYGRRDRNGDLVNPNNISLGQIATAIGEPLEMGSGSGELGDGKNSRAAQQAGFHAYANMMNNASSYDADTQFAIRNFMGQQQEGDPDETGMRGYLGTNVSPIDDFESLDLDGDGIVQPEELDPNGRGSNRYASVYGNTTAGELTGIKSTSVDYGCQCDDPNGDFYMEKDENGKCPCDPKEDKKKCPCEKKDGSIIDVGVDPATGDCLPCEENENILVEDEPAPWWLQDTIKTTGAFGDLMGIKKYMPWAPRVDLEEPDAIYADPTRELAAQAEQANIQTQAISQFAGAQAQSARAASIQGQAAKQAADTLNQYNVNNIAAANANEQQKVGIRNQEQLTNQQISQNLYDQTTVANQQFDNAKLAARTNLRNLYTNAITNRQKQQNLNALNEQYDINPADGGSLAFKGGRDMTGKRSTVRKSYGELKTECQNEGATSEAEIKQCIEMKEKLQASATSVSNSGTPPGYGGVNAGNLPIQGNQKGGYVYDDGGFVYASNVYPFIL